MGSRTPPHFLLTRRIRMDTSVCYLNTLSRFTLLIRYNNEKPVIVIALLADNNLRFLSFFFLSKTSLIQFRFIFIFHVRFLHVYQNLNNHLVAFNKTRYYYYHHQYIIIIINFILSVYTRRKTEELDKVRT